MFSSNTGNNPAEQALLTITTRAMEQTHEAMVKVSAAMERVILLEEDVKRLQKSLEQHMASEEKMFAERLEREKQLEVTMVGIAKTVGNLQALMSERAIEADAQVDKELNSMKQTLREEFFKYREDDLRKQEEKQRALAERFDSNCTKVNDKISTMEKQIQRLEDSSTRFESVSTEFSKYKEEILKLKTDHDRLEKIGIAVVTAAALAALKLTGVV